MTYEGGYLLHKNPLVKVGMNRHTSVLTDPVSPVALEAINAVQDTSWRINSWLLDVIRECWHNDIQVPSLPSPEDIHIPGRMPEDVWDLMSDEEKSAYRRDKALKYTENTRRVSKRDTFLRQLAIAERMRDEDAIYFPHNLDFRMRMYPIPRDLNPQGDDVAKSLLMFAEGKPVGQRGYFWLQVHAANAFGQDKLPLAERVAFIQEHMEDVVLCGADPIRHQWWTEADEPFCFLAACRELRYVGEFGLNHVSHLPVQVDGSCNGLQHLSALGRDRVGAVATNVAANVTRRDIYQQVAETCGKLVAEDVSLGIPEASTWAGKITRKVVKRAVMTTPYGVTSRGIRDQLVADKHTHAVLGEGETGHQKVADYLTGVIQRAMDQTVSSASDIMGYLQDVAGVLADHDLPMQWTNAAGCRVQQAYYRMNGKRIATLFGKLTFLEENQDAGLDGNKQRNGAAPNFIHSQDAAHLALTVVKAKAQGIGSFSMIHDSYGSHASDMDTLAGALRDTFAEIYSVDVLGRFHQEQLEVAEPLGIELPTPPVLGDFDVAEVHQSQFFFA